MFYRAFDKKTLEYKGTFELIEGREPQEYFVVCETSQEIKIPDGKKCIFDLVKKTIGYKFISKREFTEL